MIETETTEFLICDTVNNKESNLTRLDKYYYHSKILSDFLLREKMPTLYSYDVVKLYAENVGLEVDRLFKHVKRIATRENNKIKVCSLILLQELKRRNRLLPSWFYKD